jgi:hypothetical protein
VRVSRVAIVALVLSVVLSGCGSGSANAIKTYGPPGHRFSVAFPSPPIQEVDTSNVSGGLPLTSKVYGYQVSPERDIYAASAGVPRPPSFGVAIAVFRSTSVATRLAEAVAQSVGAKTVRVHGLLSYQKVAAEGSFRDQSTPTDPTASEGFLIVRQEKTDFVVVTVTTHAATARAFIASFRFG